MILGQRLDGSDHTIRPALGQPQQEGHQLASEQQSRRRVAAVQLVAHMQRATHDRLQRNAAREPHRLAQHRGNRLAHILQAVMDPLVVDAIVQAARIRPLIEIAITDIAARSIADDKYRHRGRIDAGERADRAVPMATVDADRSGFEQPHGFVHILGQPLEQHTADDRRALATDILAKRQRGARGEDGLVRHPRQNLDRRPDVLEHRIGGYEAAEALAVGLDPTLGRGPAHLALAATLA